VPIEITVLQVPHPYLEMIASGALTQQDLEDAVALAQDVAAKNGVWDVLNDSTAVTALPGTGALYWLGELVANLHDAPRLRVALVQSGFDRTPRMGDFWETTARNRMLDVRAFTDRPSAESWLAAGPGQASS
jgi:hypothetical protein